MAADLPFLLYPMARIPGERIGKSLSLPREPSQHSFSLTLQIVLKKEGLFFRSCWRKTSRRQEEVTEAVRLKVPVIFSSSGTVQASGGMYITRPADEELFNLCREGTYAHVLTSRQMGKSSLRVAVSERLRQEGIQIASIDLTTIGTQADSAEQWYVSLLEKIEQDLRISQVLPWWEAHQHLTPTDRFMRYLLSVVLTEVRGSLVIFVDEIDTTLSLPFSADDFFAAIRSLFNARAELPDAQRLSFVLIGSASPGDLIRSSSRTPFNIGRGVTLRHFSEESAKLLAEGFALPALEREDLMHRIFGWTAGHPYLTQRLCMAVTQENGAAWTDLEPLVRRVFVVSGEMKDSNLEWVRDMLTERAPDREAVLTVWRDVLRGRKVLDEETSIAKSHLKLTGVVRAAKGRLVPSNRIYATAFDDAWVLQHLPQDLERQHRLARYRSLTFIGGGVALVLAAVGGVMGVLWQRAQVERDRAGVAEKRASDAKDLAEMALSEAKKQQLRAEAERNSAEKQQLRAEAAASEAKARQLVAQAEALRQLPGHHFTLASLLDLESLRRTPIAAGRSAVLSALDLAVAERMRLENQGSVNALAISPDGRWLVTANSDNTARIWDATTGKERARLEHQGEVTQVAISPDGQWLVTADIDHRARIWDAVTGKVRSRLEHESAITAVAVSPNSQWLVTCSNDTARIWDAATGQERSRLKHQGLVRATAISSDGRWLVTGSNDNAARIWDTATGQERFRLEHEDPVGAVAISPDGRWLVTATDGKTAIIWDVMTWRERARLEHKGLISSVEISPDGRWLVTAGSGTVRTWDTATWRERSHVSYDGTLYKVAIDPDGRWYVTTTGARVPPDYTTQIWDAATGRKLARIEHRDVVSTVAISPDGKWFVTAGRENTTLWLATTGREHRRLEHQDWIKTAAASSDGKWMVTATGESSERAHTAHIWDVARGQERGRIRHNVLVEALAISSDGRWLVTADSDTTVRIWDAATGQERARLEHQGGVNALAISPSGHWLVTAGADGTARIWDAATGREVGRVEHQGPVMAVAISPDGQWFVTVDYGSSIGGLERVARIWDVATLRERDRLKYQGPVTAVAISPDGQWLVTGTGGLLDPDMAHIWELATGRKLASLEHGDRIDAVAISPDGHWFVTTSGRTARIWNVASGADFLTLQFPDTLRAAAFIPGSSLVAFVHGHSITLEPWQTEDLIHDLCARVTRNLTRDEWKQYIGDEPYRRTCPNLSEPKSAEGAKAD
jgi:WD40 repeat protein